MKKILTTSGDKLYINGEPFSLRAGAIHYFRVHPSQWEDRLKKLKLCGLNTVETYIAWNVQEPKRGEFPADGFADFERFIGIAEEVGLYVVVRPGPFICAEWEMGGFPAWLLNIDGIELRAYNEPYLNCIDGYFKGIMPRIVPHLSTNGGGIIAVQVENEFGGFGKPDNEYLTWIKDKLIEYGVDVPFFTSDGWGGDHLEKGSLDGVLMTANFGSRAEIAFERLESLRPGEPKICMEFWNGWFDQWGVPHHTREAQETVDTLKYMLENDWNFNLYMFHGGTNFGFMNGANCNPHFEPCITSYDYYAPLSENGEPTEKYYLIKELLTGSRTDSELEKMLSEYKKKSFGRVSLKTASVFANLDILGVGHTYEQPVNMEVLGQNYGFTVYDTDVTGMSGVLDIGEPRDYAVIYGDGKLLGIYERGADYEPIMVSGIKKLRILVENLGRVNYGQRIFDKKGIVGSVTVGGRKASDFLIYTLPMNHIPELDFTGETVGLDEPMLYKGEFEVDKPYDTFINFEGFTHGNIWINDFNLGRYRSVGPQKTLYVPSGVLRHGKNKIVVLDLFKTMKNVIEFTDEPILDGTV